MRNSAEVLNDDRSWTTGLERTRAHGFGAADFHKGAEPRRRHARSVGSKSAQLGSIMMLTDPIAAKPATAPVPDGLPKERRRWAVAAIFTALAMASLDTAIANIALPAIAGDPHVGPADVIWMVNVYQIALVATFCHSALSAKLSVISASIWVASCCSLWHRSASPWRDRCLVIAANFVSIERTIQLSARITLPQNRARAIVVGPSTNDSATESAVACLFYWSFEYAGQPRFQSGSFNLHDHGLQPLGPDQSHIDVALRERLAPSPTCQLRQGGFHESGMRPFRRQE